MASALELDRPLGAVAALSPMLPPKAINLCSQPKGLLPVWLQGSEQTGKASSPQGTKFLICHGDHDRVVPAEFGNVLYDWLAERGFGIRLALVKQMAHEMTLDSVWTAREFLVHALPPIDDKGRIKSPSGGVDSGGVAPAPGAAATPASGSSKPSWLRAASPADGPISPDAAGQQDADKRESLKQGLTAFLQGWSDPSAKLWPSLPGASASRPGTSASRPRAPRA